MYFILQDKNNSIVIWCDKDLEIVIAHLKERRPLQNVPLWIKDLMGDVEARESDEDSKLYY